MPSALVTPGRLHAELGRVVVLDVQYNLVGTPGSELYAAEHLPGARFVDLDTDLAGPPGDNGRHPLPEPAAVGAALRRCGVDAGSRVVVYDERTSLSAARAWFVLRLVGCADVRVLDGGLAAWRAAGLPTTTEVPQPEPGSFTTGEGVGEVLDADGAGRLASDGVLLDSRAAERFRGEVEPIDPVAGHVPGAVNAPMADYLDADGRFLPPDALRAYFADRGIRPGTPVGTSCGSGVTAAHTALALHEVGIEAGVYVGSWSEWVSDPRRPVARGR